MPTQDQLIADIGQHYAMAHHHLSKMKASLDALTSVHEGGLPPASKVRCVREFTDYLTSHGPNRKSEIETATGVKFTERGSQFTVEWSAGFDGAPDDKFAANTIMKINSPSTGRGRPPVIYFLWSQRYDVRPLFGVGPEKADGVLFAEGPVLGVIEPPTVPAFPYEFGEPAKMDQPTVDTVPSEGYAGYYADIDGWNREHAAYFDDLVATDRKPSDEEKARLTESMPPGTDAATTLALAYGAAVQRSRSGS